MNLKNSFKYIFLIVLIFANIGNSSCYFVTGRGMFYDDKNNPKNLIIKERFLEINRSKLLDALYLALKTSPKDSFGYKQLKKLIEIYSGELANYTIKENLFLKLKKDYPNCGFENALVEQKKPL